MLKKCTKWRLQISMLFYFTPDTEDRKHGEQNGLETRVVHALNDEFSTWKVIIWVWANASNTPPDQYGGNIENQRYWRPFK